MVAEERRKGAKSGPASTERLGSVAAKSAGVWSDHADAVKGGESGDLTDRRDVGRPVTERVAEPLLHRVTRAGKGRAGDRERLLARNAREQGLVRADAHVVPVEVVDLVLGLAVVVLGVRPDGEVADVLQIVGSRACVSLGGRSTAILNAVGRVEQRRVKTCISHIVGEVGRLRSVGILAGEEPREGEGSRSLCSAAVHDDVVLSGGVVDRVGQVEWCEAFRNGPDRGPGGRKLSLG